MSRSGSLSRSICGTEATSSLVPTQAEIDECGTDSSPKRRSNQAAAAPISAGLPADAG